MAINITQELRLQDDHRIRFGDSTYDGADGDLVIYNTNNQPTFDVNGALGNTRFIGGGYEFRGRGETYTGTGSLGNKLFEAKAGGTRLYYDGTEEIRTANTGLILGNTASVHQVHGSFKINKALRRTITTVTGSSNVFTFNCSDDNDNFEATLNNATNTIKLLFDVNDARGSSGTIVLTNPSSVGSFAINQITAENDNGASLSVLTPGGSNVDFDLTANRSAILTYFAQKTNSTADGKVFINYVGGYST